jgi:restriction system protein
MYPASIDTFLKATSRDIGRQLRFKEARELEGIREAERAATTRRAAMYSQPVTFFATAREQTRAEKSAYFERRQQEVDHLNEQLTEILFSLDQILARTMRAGTVGFGDLELHEPQPTLSFDEKLLYAEPKPDERDFLLPIVAPTGMRAWLPGVRRQHDLDVQEAQNNFAHAMENWNRSEAERAMKLREIKTDFEQSSYAHEQKKGSRAAETRIFRESYEAGHFEAIIAYHAFLLERSYYTNGCHHEFSLAYTAASKMLVIEYRLPDSSIVPAVEEFRYVKAGDKITEKVRKQSGLASIYSEMVASIALRTLAESFELDQADHIDVVCLNGYIHTVDPATGKDIRPYLLSVRTTKAAFAEIDLTRVDKQVCLRNLGAQVSRNLDEAVPVRPIVEFQMTDARFVDQADLVSALSSAPNLMDLTPTEFEHLVANLFGKMGLETKLTRSSRDGGVDCVAFDPRPILGGKVVIQAKRYRHTVGVAAVRDLFGTMMNEGASKGLLVTTSGFGPDAYEFVKNKPIELIDGGGLLFLLQEIGFPARILMPED